MNGTSTPLGQYHGYHGSDFVFTELPHYRLLLPSDDDLLDFKIRPVDPNMGKPYGTVNWGDLCPETSDFSAVDITLRNDLRVPTLGKDELPFVPYLPRSAKLRPFGPAIPDGNGSRFQFGIIDCRDLMGFVTVALQKDSDMTATLTPLYWYKYRSPPLPAA